MEVGYGLIHSYPVFPVDPFAYQCFAYIVNCDPRKDVFLVEENAQDGGMRCIVQAN
jgi:hypothetical protein